MLLKYLRCSRRYCLWYYSEQWGHNTTSNKKSGRTLLPACLRSRTQVNFAGMLAVKTEVASVAGDFCSHIGTVSQVVPINRAYMLQVARWHMRTKLYAHNFLWPIFLFQIKDHTHTFHLIKKFTILTQLTLKVFSDLNHIEAMIMYLCMHATMFFFIAIYNLHFYLCFI